MRAALLTDPYRIELVDRELPPLAPGQARIRIRQCGVCASELDLWAGKELDKLPENRVPSRRDWSGLSGTWTYRIDDRIAELERLKLGLTECIACGCLSLDRCKLANPGDRAARLGPGPHYWLGDL